MNKPEPIVYVQRKELIFGAVNKVLSEYNLPAYLAEVIIDEVSRQIKQLSQEELNRAFKDFEEANKQEEKQEDSKEEEDTAEA